MLNDFLRAWKALDTAKGDDWYQAANYISNLISKYSKKVTSKADLSYLKWNEQKLRSLLVAPSLHNGGLEKDMKRLIGDKR